MAFRSVPACATLNARFEARARRRPANAHGRLSHSTNRGCRRPSVTVAFIHGRAVTSSADSALPGEARGLKPHRWSFERPKSSRAGACRSRGPCCPLAVTRRAFQPPDQCPSAWKPALLGVDVWRFLLGDCDSGPSLLGGRLPASTITSCVGMERTEGSRDVDHRAVAWPGGAVISLLPAHALLPLVPSSDLLTDDDGCCSRQAKQAPHASAPRKGGARSPAARCPT